MELLKRLAKSRLWDIALLLLACASLFRLASDLPARANRIDLAHYYAGSRLLWETGHPYQQDLSTWYEQHGFNVPEGINRATNPPLLLWLFLPFALLPPVGAFIAWNMLQALALVYILWQTKQLLGDRLTKRAWQLLCLAAISTHAIYYHFTLSQGQLLLAGLVLAAFALYRQQKYTSATLLVTLAGMMKLFPLILIHWFLVRGRWKSIAAALALVIGTILITGLHNWSDYFRFSYPVVTSWTLGHSYNCSLPSFILNLGAPPGSACIPNYWWPVASMLGLLVIAAAYLPCRQARCDDELEFSLLSVAMLTGSLVAWGHYLVFLIFPAAIWISRIMKNPEPSKIFLFVLSMVLLNIGPQRSTFLDAHPYLNVLINWIPLFGLLAFGFGLIQELKSCNSKLLAKI